MLLGDLGATVIKVESPAGDDTRTWMPPVKDGVSTYYLSIGRNKRSITLDFRDPDDRELAAELLRRADIAIENFRPGALGKFALDYESAARAEPWPHLPLDQRLRDRRRSLAPRLRPDRAGGLRPDEPDRRPRRTAVPRRHLGVRRHGRAARPHRRAGRAPPAQRDRARAARRGEPAVVRDVRARQPDGGLHRGRRGPEPDGQRAPEPVPLRDDAHGGPGHDHHRRQQPAVPVAVRGARHPRGGRRRAVRDATPTARATGRSCVPCCSSSWPSGRPTTCSSR